MGCPGTREASTSPRTKTAVGSAVTRARPPRLTTSTLGGANRGVGAGVNASKGNRGRASGVEESERPMVPTKPENRSQRDLVEGREQAPNTQTRGRDR